MKYIDVIKELMVQKYHKKEKSNEITQPEIY